jgi:hypothetical protein
MTKQQNYTDLAELYGKDTVPTWAQSERARKWRICKLILLNLAIMVGVVAVGYWLMPE